MLSGYSKYTKELSKRFDAANNIVIICHVNPDGDAIGSQLALYYYLLSKGKSPEMISPNKLQDFLTWMDGVDKIRIFIRDRKKCSDIISGADLIVMVDFNQSNRLGEAEDAVLRSKASRIIIDHHLNGGNFSDLVVADTKRCSTSELIWLLLSEMNGNAHLNRAFSEAVYVGIITDTGNFEHGLYSGITFRIIADILDSGIDKDRIYNLVFNNFSSDRMKLKGLSLNERMTILPEFRTAYIVLTKEDLEKYNYQKGDTEGFVNMPLSIRGIDFSVLFIEKKDHIKISFRSKGSFAVNEFAQKYFKGGGHRNASGGEYDESLDKCIAYFLEALGTEGWKLNELHQK